MFKSITANSITAVATAALLAGLAVFLTSVAREARAESQITSALAKGDRLAPLVRGAACSSRSWPNYDQSCQFDLRRPADETRLIRIIALR